MIITLSFLLLFSLAAHSSPTPSNGRLALPLKRVKRSPIIANDDLYSTRHNLEAKYLPPSASRTSRRQNSGATSMTNYNADTSYFVTVEVGTPLAAYDIVLDTGSSDFWLVSDACLPGCSASNLAFYNPGASSTYNTAQSKLFGINYFGGSVNGTTAAETVKLAGITVQNQQFGVITSYDENSGVLPRGVSGLMGLAWDSLTRIGIPFWENSAKATPSWPEPLFTFAISRQNNNPEAQVYEPGGLFTIGFTDPTIYTGEIDYVPLVDSSWWLIPLTEVSIAGSTIEISGQYAAIDTGTTLIGGPTAEVVAMYTALESSGIPVQQGVGNTEGFYFLPCSANVALSFTFGSKTWSVDPSDFLTETGTPGICRGAIFSGVFGQPGTASPTWIIGDVFLKNVYSVYRYSPPAVGFATLANPAALLVNSTLPTAGAVTATASPLATLGPATQTRLRTTYSYNPVAATGSPASSGAETGRPWSIPSVVFGAVLAAALL